jgi:surface polysaccharide O-acyltransferase-like enzyme
MTASSPGRGFIRHLHAFRGFAILGVVALHSWDAQIGYFAGTERSSGEHILENVNGTLFHDSTNYFALISGLLFSLALRRRGWEAFFRSKATNVLVPYVLMTLLYTLHGANEDRELMAPPGGLQELTTNFMWNLLHGSGFYHLWYIPVFLMLCVATPLLIRLIERPGSRWAVATIVLLPLVVSRTGVILSWQSVVYYLGVYTIGVVVGAHYELVSRWLRANWLLSLIVAFLSSLALLASFRSGVDIVAGFTSVRESLFYIQKLAASGVVLVVFRLFEDRLPEWLMKVSSEAFPIYFLHPLIHIVLYRAQLLAGVVPSGAFGMFVGGFAYLVLSVGIALLVSSLARLALGKRSRVLIGA